jgi:hypothetical protein
MDKIKQMLVCVTIAHVLLLIWLWLLYLEKENVTTKVGITYGPIVEWHRMRIE